VSIQNTSFQFSFIGPGILKSGLTVYKMWRHLGLKPNSFW